MRTGLSSAYPGFTGQWNLAGIPAMAIPTGFSSTGLPLSMQIVSGAFNEAAAFKAGDAFQRLTDFHLRIPTHARLEEPVAAH